MKNKLHTNRKKRALQAGLFYLLFAVAYFTFMFPEGLSQIGYFQFSIRNIAYDPCISLSS